MYRNLKTTIIAFCFLLPSFLSGQEIEGKSKIEVKYIEQVESLDELLNKFKGHIVYIDFWASWCSPCIKEFEHKLELDTFLEENNIIRLYIAIEKQEKNPAKEKESIAKWKKLVEKHNLRGFNYYSQLKTDFFWDISKQIMKGKLSLPRFAIINKEGVIVEQKAKKPSDNNKLIKQLAKYIE